MNVRGAAVVGASRLEIVGPRDGTTAGFWTITGAGAVRKYLQPSGPLITVASGLRNPGQIVLDATSVYWLDEGDGSIQKLDKTTPGGLPTNIATGETAARRIAVDDVNVYGRALTKAASKAGPFAIAVDASGLYWANVGDGTIHALRK